MKRQNRRSASVGRPLGSELVTPLFGDLYAAGGHRTMSPNAHKTSLVEQNQTRVQGGRSCHLPVPHGCSLDDVDRYVQLLRSRFCRLRGPAALEMPAVFDAGPDNVDHANTAGNGAVPQGAVVVSAAG